jgi:prolyl 4-hydroxylase
MLYRFPQSFLLLIILAETYVGFGQDDAEEVTYGLDVSFPIHDRVSTDNPLGDRHQMYTNHLDGCRKHYSASFGDKYSCDEFEYDRIIMNRRQPQSMVNLTESGFTKIRSPPKLKELIDEFWKDNKDKAKIEAWHSGNSYVNHWDSPTTLVSVDDKGLRGSGERLKEHIWAAASAVLEEWTQVELQPCSLYGIRVYHEGAIMMPHVDRLPLVASAVINVAQDVEEDWPTVSEIDVGSSNRVGYKGSQNVARRPGGL